MRLISLFVLLLAGCTEPLLPMSLGDGVDGWVAVATPPEPDDPTELDLFDDLQEDVFDSPYAGFMPGLDALVELATHEPCTEFALESDGDVLRVDFDGCARVSLRNAYTVNLRDDRSGRISWRQTLTATDPERDLAAFCVRTDFHGTRAACGTARYGRSYRTGVSSSWWGVATAMDVLPGDEARLELLLLGTGQLRVEAPVKHAVLP